MSEQGRLFGDHGDEVQRVKAEAVARVEAHADADWLSDARDAVLRVARRQEWLTTDDVWAVLDAEEMPPHEPRAMGAVMRQLMAAGIIQPTRDYIESQRLICHGRPLRIWRSRLVDARGSK